MNYEVLILLIAGGLIVVSLILIYDARKKSGSKAEKEKTGKTDTSGKAPDRGEAEKRKTDSEKAGHGTPGEKGKGPDSDEIRYGKGIYAGKPGKKIPAKKEQKEYDTAVLYIHIDETPVVVCGKCGCENAKGSIVCAVCGEILGP